MKPYGTAVMRPMRTQCQSILRHVRETIDKPTRDECQRRCPPSQQRNLCLDLGVVAATIAGDAVVSANDVLPNLHRWGNTQGPAKFEKEDSQDEKDNDDKIPRRELLPRLSCRLCPSIWKQGRVLAVRVVGVMPLAARGLGRHPVFACRVHLTPNGLSWRRYHVE